MTMDFYNCELYRCLPHTLAGGDQHDKNDRKGAANVPRRDWRTGVFNNNMYLVVALLSEE